MTLITPILAIFNIGMPELIILGLLGLLIFGKRLPEVGKSLGKGIVEFKRGLAGMEDDVDRAARPRNEDRDRRRDEDRAASQDREARRLSHQDDRPSTSGPSADRERAPRREDEDR